MIGGLFLCDFALLVDQLQGHEVSLDQLFLPTLLEFFSLFESLVLNCSLFQPLERFEQQFGSHILKMPLNGILLTFRHFALPANGIKGDPQRQFPQQSNKTQVPRRFEQFKEIPGLKIRPMKQLGRSHLSLNLSLCHTLIILFQLHLSLFFIDILSQHHHNYFFKSLLSNLINNFH